MNYNYLLGSTSFSLGCIAFTVDALKTAPRNRILITGCLLFDLGCVFFMNDAINS